MSDFRIRPLADRVVIKPQAKEEKTKLILIQIQFLENLQLQI